MPSPPESHVTCRKAFVLVFYCSCKKLPQTRWLKTTQINYPTVRSSETPLAGLKARCRQGCGPSGGSSRRSAPCPLEATCPQASPGFCPHPKILNIMTRAKTLCCARSHAQVPGSGCGHDSGQHRLVGAGTASAGGQGDVRRGQTASAQGQGRGSSLRSLGGSI